MKTKLIHVLPVFTGGLALLLACKADFRNQSSTPAVPPPLRDSPPEATSSFDALMGEIEQDLKDRRNWVLPGEREAIRKMEP